MYFAMCALYLCIKEEKKREGLKGMFILLLRVVYTRIIKMMVEI